MRHLQTKTISRRNSSGIVRRRKRNQRKLISPKAFSRLHDGNINLRTFGDSLICRFSSGSKAAHAWADTPSKAYRNMIRNFNLKYAS